MFNMCRHAFEGHVHRGFGRIGKHILFNVQRPVRAEQLRCCQGAGAPRGGGGGYGFQPNRSQLEGARKGVTVNSISAGLSIPQCARSA